MSEFAGAEGAASLLIEDARGDILGFVIVHTERRCGRVRGYVVTLDVASEHRRQGLARRLMREVEARVLTEGVRWMQLHVFTGNAGAIRFYERLGYERIGTRRGYYGGSGLDAFVYGKELTGM